MLGTYSYLILIASTKNNYTVQYIRLCVPIYYEINLNSVICKTLCIEIVKYATETICFVPYKGNL